MNYQYDPKWWNKEKDKFVHDKYQRTKDHLVLATLNHEHRLPLPAEGNELLNHCARELWTFGLFAPGHKANEQKHPGIELDEQQRPEIK